jgi:hypothetical protein
MGRSLELETLPECYSHAPELVTSPYPYLVIGDLQHVLGKIDPRLQESTVTQTSQLDLLAIQKNNAPIGSSFYYIDHKTLVSKTEKIVWDNVSKFGTSVGIVNFDRYLFEGAFYPNMFRVDLSRSPTNELVGRPGSQEDAEAQMIKLADWVVNGKYETIILTDDVIAFAGTFPPVISVLRQVRPDTTIEVCAGICSSKEKWSGKEKLEQLGVAVDATVFVQASAEITGGSTGMDIPDSRDSTIFGGKIGRSPTSGRFYSFPYLLPFALPGCSRFDRSKRVQGSLDWLNFNCDLVENIEEVLGRKLKISDLETNGFGIPMSSIDFVVPVLQEPTPDTLISDHLRRIVTIFENYRLEFESKLNS